MPRPGHQSPSVQSHPKVSPGVAEEAERLRDRGGVGNQSMGVLLRLGAPGDPAERRAEAAADAVMARMAGSSGAAAGPDAAGGGGGGGGG
ncbi:MAG: hypothetical protein R3F65_04540 [bacterium]